MIFVNRSALGANSMVVELFIFLYIYLYLCVSMYNGHIAWIVKCLCVCVWLFDYLWLKNPEAGDWAPRGETSMFVMYFKSNTKNI